MLVVRSLLGLACMLLCLVYASAACGVVCVCRLGWDVQVDGVIRSDSGALMV